MFYGVFLQGLFSAKDIERFVQTEWEINLKEKCNLTMDFAKIHVLTENS